MMYENFGMNIEMAIQGVLLLMFIQLYTLIKKPAIFCIDEKYRVFGDMIFLFPIVLTLLA